MIASMAAALFILSGAVNAQRLPINQYSTSDGLAHNHVNKVFQDSKGYIWIATFEGLSRYDGYEFKNYGIDDGLGHVLINDISADNLGRIWIATNGGGVALFIDEPAGSTADRDGFSSYQIEEGGIGNYANWVNRILFDSENRMWCLTDAGLFRASENASGIVQFEKVRSARQPTSTSGSLKVGNTLWFTPIYSFRFKASTILEIDGDNLTDHIIRDPRNGSAVEIHSLVQTSDGRILASSKDDIFHYNELDETWSRLSIPPLKSMIVTLQPVAGSNGLWIGAPDGLVKWTENTVNTYTVVNGLSHSAIRSIMYDGENNLWVGTHHGLNKLSETGVVSFQTFKDGRTNAYSRILAGTDGSILVANDRCDLEQISSDGFVEPLFLDLLQRPCTTSALFADASGAWWLSTADGLKKYSSPLRQGGTGVPILSEFGERIHARGWYEDSNRNIWVTDHDEKKRGAVYKVDGETAREVLSDIAVNHIVRSKSGDLWLSNNEQLLRWREGNLQEIFVDGPDLILPRSIFEDSQGRIWIGTRYNGAYVTDDASAATPLFRRYATADGLASDTVWSIAEDGSGRIYLGTGRGIDQLDPSTGAARNIAEGPATHVIRDARGLIWAATSNGVVRIDPSLLRSNRYQNPLYISGITVNGNDHALAHSGERAPRELDLGSDQTDVSIKFVGISYFGQNELRYEYKLEGLTAEGKAEWIDLHETREVNFANLAAGSYRFIVRSMNSGGVLSEPAVVIFQIAHPFYARWWFITLASLATSGLIYLVYRIRLLKLVELERARTRIATDLHDDIGANLTKITIMSEVVRQQLGQGQNNQSDLLHNIAEVSRESVSAMGDIVWAINPKADTLLDLTQRMGQYAEEILATKGVDYDMHVPSSELNVRLDMNDRRNIFLIFKEALNNIIKHSQATKVVIKLHATRNQFTFTISDNGNGFLLSSAEGNGLANMRRRVHELGGKLKLESEIGLGTRIKLDVGRR